MCKITDVNNNQSKLLVSNMLLHFITLLYVFKENRIFKISTAFWQGKKSYYVDQTFCTDERKYNNKITATSKGNWDLFFSLHKKWSYLTKLRKLFWFLSRVYQMNCETHQLWNFMMCQKSMKDWKINFLNFSPTQWISEQGKILSFSVKNWCSSKLNKMLKILQSFVTT